MLENERSGSIAEARGDSSDPRRLIEACLIQLLETFRSANPAHVPRVPGPPTSEQLKSQVDKNFPIIFTDAFPHWPAHEAWSSSHFRRVMGHDAVTVAMTPNGRADSIVDGDLFVLPFERVITVNEMMDYLARPTGPVRYLQLQNGSLNLEFRKLAGDVDALGPAWANAVFEGPVLTNIWVGNHLSTTTLHHDPYENLYVQIRGRKIFTLFPPQAYHFLDERRYATGEYVLRGGLDQCCGDPSADLTVRKFPADAPKVPWLTMPAENHPHGTPYKVVLDPGETLYLPALWFHQVEQVDDEEGLCVAVNYWYDLDYGADLWRNWKFCRKMSMLATGGRDGECRQELRDEEGDL